jgi:hypothetical protein
MNNWTNLTLRAIRIKRNYIRVQTGGLGAGFALREVLMETEKTGSESKRHIVRLVLLLAVFVFCLLFAVIPLAKGIISAINLETLQADRSKAIEELDNAKNDLRWNLDRTLQNNSDPQETEELRLENQALKNRIKRAENDIAQKSGEIKMAERIYSIYMSRNKKSESLDRVSKILAIIKDLLGIVGLVWAGTQIIYPWLRARLKTQIQATG